MSKSPLRREGLLERAWPFLFGMAAAFPAAFLVPSEADVSLIDDAAIITAIIIVAVAVLPWSRISRAWHLLPPLMYFVVIAFLRQSGGGTGTGYGPLVLLPFLWVLLYGNKVELRFTMVFVIATFAIPPFLTDSATKTSDWERAVMWALVIPIIAYTIQGLMAKARMETVAAQEGERRRVARELHDEVGQTLTGLLLQLQRASRDAPEALRAQIDEAREGARTSLEEIRRIGRELRPEALDDLGLESALGSLVNRFTETGGPRVTAVIEPDLPVLSPEGELVVYRIVQEALTNVARHAGASHVEVRLERTRGRTVRLRVSDDGRGLPPARTLDGSGIRGMRERARAIDARFALEPGRHGGTQVVLEFEGEAMRGRARDDDWRSRGPFRRAPKRAPDRSAGVVAGP
jgi:signal transduction histidine kinase